MMRPQFSVVIPVYNVAPYLRECLDSLLEQTVADWEAICVDDGSTDNSAEIIKEYARKDNRVKTVFQQNKGVVAARYAGFRASQGEWVAFVDGDDVISPSYLKTILENVEEGIDILQFGFRYVKPNGEVAEVLPAKSGTEDVFSLCMEFKRTPIEFLSMCVGNKCYRRDLVERVFSRIGDIRVKHSEDGLFAMAAFFQAKRMRFIPVCLYDYVLRAGSASRRINLRVTDDMEEFVAALESHVLSLAPVGEKAKHNVLAYHAYDSVRHCVHCSLDRGLSALECRKMLRALARAKFFGVAAGMPLTCSHRIVRCIVRMPWLFAGLRLVLRKMLPVK